MSANGTIIVNSVPKTYVPDDNFEAYLETHDANGNVVSVGDANSMGDGIANNDSVTTANVSGFTSLAINLQSITDLTGLEEFISLSYLNAYGNGINSVDFSQNILLDTVIFFSNNLVTIDLSQNDSISYLDLKSNNLNAINVTNLTKIKFLKLQSNNLSSIDLSQNLELINLNLSYNSLSNETFLANNDSLKISTINKR